MSPTGTGHDGSKRKDWALKRRFPKPVFWGVFKCPRIGPGSSKSSTSFFRFGQMESGLWETDGNTCSRHRHRFVPVCLTFVFWFTKSLSFSFSVGVSCPQKGSGRLPQEAWQLVIASSWHVAVWSRLAQRIARQNCFGKNLFCFARRPIQQAVVDRSRAGRSREVSVRMPRSVGCVPMVTRVRVCLTIPELLLC